MRQIRLHKIWDSLRSSYWFLPSVMAGCTIVFTFVLLTIDGLSSIDLGKLGWFYSGGPDGARAVLSAVAGSMATVTATAFSITIVALQLASSNFGPRLLRNFMQDVGNQIVLGTFISTFIYCLLVLRSIRGEDYNFFVPQLSVTVGLMLAIASIGVLIYFIHHASTIIQVSHVMAEVSTDLQRSIDRLFPAAIGQEPREVQHIGEIPHDFEAELHSIPAKETGYLQAIDEQGLIDIAREHDLILQLKLRPSKFVIEGSELLLAYPGKRISPKLISQLHGLFLLGRERTEQQDIEFPIDQLVEIGLRAISPGINDPFTAIRCIDRLSAGLSALAQRTFPSPHRFDEAGNLRVIAKPITFEQLVATAFNQLRQYSRSDIGVTIRLLEAIRSIVVAADRPKDLAVLRRHAEMIYRGSREAVSEEHDLQDIEERYFAVIQALDQHRSATG